jgi:hypothetical protein
VLTVICEIGPRAPETAKEGIQLRAGPVNFNKQVSGTTLFQRDID